MVDTKRTTAGAAQMQPQCQCCLTDGDLVANQVLMTNALVEVLEARDYYEHPERPIICHLDRARALAALSEAEVALDKHCFKTAMRYATYAKCLMDIATGRML